jgi:hypothetical protein
MAHWKQTRWDTYTLIANGHNKTFDDYDALFRYCRKFGIDATQV